jgi:small GTP-binding protein
MPAIAKKPPLAPPVASEATFDYDVFLSHHSSDKPRVRKLASALKEAGLRVWLDEWEIKAGDDIRLAIERGLERSRCLVLCITAQAIASKWVATERSTVLFRDPVNTERRFIPLLFSDCELPDTLRRYRLIDFRKGKSEALEELISVAQPPQTSVRPEVPASPASPVSDLTQAEARESEHGSDREVEPKPEIPAGFTLLRVLERHPDHVHSIAWAPSGELLAASYNTKGAGAVRLWKMGAEGKALTLPRAAGMTLDLTWSPDSTKLLVVYLGEPPKLWNVARRRFIRTGIALEDPVVASWSPSGDLVAIGTQHDTLHLFRAADWTQAGVLSGHSAAIKCVAWSADGTALASGALDHQIILWDVTKGRIRSRLKGHSGQVNAVVWTGDGQQVVSASEDKTIRVWNSLTSERRVLEGHAESVSSLSLSADGNLLASHAAGATFIWETQTWDAVAQLHQDSDTCLFTRVAFAPHADLLTTPGSTGRHQIEIWRLDRSAVSAQLTPTLKYISAKVILVGEPGAGKTSLAHRLVEDKFILTSATHGMSIWRLDIPVEKADALAREVFLWDFAGQVDYRLIHQLFLEDTALVLYVMNPQASDPFREAVDWLRMIDAAVASSKGTVAIPRLLVPSRVDVGGLRISDQKIAGFRRELGFAACIPTSASRGDGCSDSGAGGTSDLKQAIAREIPWQSLASTATPELLVTIKNEVIALRDKADIRLLRFNELVQRLDQAMPAARLTEADIRTALRLLANHGIVQLLRFGDLVLLRPDLLSAYASSVISAAQANTDQIGCIAEEDVLSGRVDFRNVSRLASSGDEELLLRALVQLLLDKCLCFKELEGGKTLLIFPSQFRREREIPAYPSIFMSFSFSGELQTIFATLVVRLWHSDRFRHKEIWRNAAEFATTRGQTVGLITERLVDGSGRIGLFAQTEVADELRLVLSEFVQKHLSKYAQNVIRERRYLCERGHPVTDLAAVRYRLERGLKWIHCAFCGRKIQFYDHIEEALAGKPTFENVALMEAAVRQKLDTQALEQILVGHMQAVCGEANQIFRPVTTADFGIDGEIEFKDDSGAASGRRIYVQLKSGKSYLRTRRTDGAEIFDVKKPRHLDYWVSQPADVFLVIRTDNADIRWMNLTQYLKTRKKSSRQIVFKGERLDATAIWRVRDLYCSTKAKPVARMSE